MDFTFLIIYESVIKSIKKLEENKKFTLNSCHSTRQQINHWKKGSFAYLINNRLHDAELLKPVD